MTARQPARGVTLVELLVVIGVTAVLIGLLLPAVQKVRASADRVSCQQRMRQLAIGLHNLHSVDNRLPRGHIPLTSPARRHTMPFTGWHLAVTPHVDQPQMLGIARDDFRADPSGMGRYRGEQVVIAAFGCPADPSVRSLQPESLSGRLMGYTSYFGVSGTNLLRRDGVLFPDSMVGLHHVTDGTSQTLLLGERPPSDRFPYGQWYMAFGQRHDGSASHVLGVREVVVFSIAGPCGFGPYHFGPGQTTNPCDNFHFWSPHPGGANFAFTDGSVRFLPYFAADVLPALATRAGGEVAAVPD